VVNIFNLTLHTWATEGEFVSPIITAFFDNMRGKARAILNPLEDYRFFHHWFSEVKTRNNGGKINV
jgi:hypothetical protein